MKICFVHQDTYPVLTGTSDTTYLGGEAVQHTLLARAFAARGHEVSVVVGDFGQEDGAQLGAVRAFKTCKRSAGLPVIRFLHPRTSSLWRALLRADAEIYYFSCADYVPAVLALFCERHGGRFAFRVAHDTDCVPGEHLLRFKRDHMLYAYGLRRAHFIFAQTVKQQKLLTAHYGLHSDVVNMLVEEPVEDLNAERDIDVLWVNNFRPFKRPEIMVDLAQRCPELRFTMIGGPVPGYEEYYRGIIEDCRRIPNLDALGPVPYRDVNSYFARAKVFVNTSESEGFPNSFLQAWIRGVPIVSFFDPDGLLEHGGLGAGAHDVDEMAATLSSLIADEARHAELSRVVRRYALDSYSASAVVERYEKLLGA